MPQFKPVIITTTTPNPAEAEKIGLALLENQLAACVQYENIKSQYMWQGKMCEDHEIRMIIKTSRCYYAAIEKIIKQHHSYSCPQILMQTISRGYIPYLRWLKTQLGL